MLELMTPHEMLDMGRSHVIGASDDINGALVLSSAYLLAAYRVGRELSKFQVSIITIGFILSVGQAIWSAYIENNIHLRWADRGSEPVYPSLTILYGRLGC